MATQGVTLQRRGMHVPIWLIAAMIAIAVAATITAIGLRVFDDVRPVEPIASIQGTSDAVREARLDAWSARVHDVPAGPFHEAGRAHEVVVYTRGLP